MSNWNFATKTIQSGYQPADGEARIVPIVQSTTYKYDDAQSVADLFDLKREGFFYTRLANPTVDAFEKKIADLEKGVAAVALNSGQTANAFAILNVAKAGDHILSTSGLYGGTVALFSNTLKKFGVEVTFFDTNISAEELAKLVRPNTKAIFAESLANPALIVADFEVYATVAHANQIPLIVDNTFPTPFFCNPFDFGADIVTHSSTKYIDGHATSVGGIVVEKGDFDWVSSGKFPEFSEPDASYHGLIYTKDFAACPFSVKLRVQAVRDLGISMTPMNAFLTNLGVETLHLRMERHNSNTIALAEFLKNHPKVAWVNYPGLADSPEQPKVKKYLRGTSGVLTFGAVGGRSASEKVMNSLKLAAIVVHVADVRTGVLHPASMTHRQLSESELIAAGITPDLVRVTVGIEDIADIIADFEQALAKI